MHCIRTVDGDEIRQSVNISRTMSSTQHEMEEHRADDEDRQMPDSAGAGLSDNDGFLVPSPIPTRRSRTYSQYVISVMI